MLGILDDLPRASLCHVPTRLAAMSNLCQAIGLSSGFVKSFWIEAFGGLESEVAMLVVGENRVVLLVGFDEGRAFA